MKQNDAASATPRRAANWRAAWSTVLLASSLFVSAPAVSAGEAAAVKPQRIVSLNLCTDQLIADLVARERIAAVSFLGLDPTMSSAATKLAGIRAVQGAAEEVLALDPDLVVTSAYSTPATLSLLRRLGRRVVTVPLAGDFDGIRGAIATLAQAAGETEKGRELVAGFDLALARVSAPAGPRPTAVAYQVNSLVSSKGSLVDAILTAAGFDNLAAPERLGPGGRLPLEALVASPPDLLILAHGPDDFRTAVADNLRHPALRSLTSERPTMRLAMPLWLCGTPAVAGAVRRLADMRDQLVARGAAR